MGAGGTAVVRPGQGRAGRVDGVHAVLLDLGGVLIEVRFELTLALWERSAGLDPGSLAGRVSADARYEQLERGECDFADYAGHLRERIGAPLGDDALLAGWNAALGDALDGAAELVADVARRWPVYLFSNSNAAHHACWSERHAALLAPMRAVFSSHVVGARKPDAVAFERVAARIGLAPGAIAFFDDLDVNVEGARRAGLRAWRARGPGEVRRALGL